MMITLMLWLSVMCSACLSLPVPLTKASTSAPPYNGFTVFPLCDKDCNGFPGYKVTTFRSPDEEDREGKELTTTTTISTTTTTTVSTTTTTVPTTTTTTTISTTTTATTSTSTTTEVSSTPGQPESSTVFAHCDGNCPRMPAFKVASETVENGADVGSRTGRMEEPSKLEHEDLSRPDFEERPEPEPKPEVLPTPEPELSETSPSSTASPESSSSVVSTTTTVKTASVEAVDAESTDNTVINETPTEEVFPTTEEIEDYTADDAVDTGTHSEVVTEESSKVGEGTIR